MTCHECGSEDVALTDVLDIAWCGACWNAADIEAAANARKAWGE
jgi:hypothetical protein